MILIITKSFKKTYVMSFLFLFCLVNAKETGDWRWKLQSDVNKISKKFEGEIGLYVKKLSNGSVYSLNANTPWYYASMTKVVIAIELFRQIQRGEISLLDKVELKKTDYCDGSGLTNWIDPGAKVSIKYLLDQMLIESDNTAADMLIRRIGLGNINRIVQKIIPKDFYIITTLFDVRREIYSKFHSKAGRLSNIDFFEFRKIKDENKKLELLSQKIKVPIASFYVKTFDEAFDKYYSMKENSGTLTAYALLLEKLVSRKVLNAKYTLKLLNIMKRCNTGRNRLIKGLGSEIDFAHKTGTKRKRICDAGIAGSMKNLSENNKLIIVACVKNFNDIDKAEAVLAEIGRSMRRAGALRQ